jgi:hypothetical protein
VVTVGAPGVANVVILDVAVFVLPPVSADWTVNEYEVFPAAPVYVNVGDVDDDAVRPVGVVGIDRVTPLAGVAHVTTILLPV